MMYVTEQSKKVSPGEVSLLRLYLLRGGYLLIVVGLGITVWPEVINRSGSWELMEGVVQCMLLAFRALCVLGLRYPLQMLPVLLWEIAWKRAGCHDPLLVCSCYMVIIRYAILKTN